jgi:hypothetical protein
MARSNVIWVVLDNYPIYPDCGISATFTVKHELTTWLGEQTDTLNLRVFRCPDNPRWPDSPKPVEMAMENFL